MKLIFTRRALKRLTAIIEYYLPIAGSAVANEIREQILGAIDGLPAFPSKGQLEPYLAHRKKLHRRLVVGNYKIIYRIELEAIFIIDIFDSRQHPKKMKTK